MAAARIRLLRSQSRSRRGRCDRSECAPAPGPARRPEGARRVCAPRTAGCGGARCVPGRGRCRGRRIVPRKTVQLQLRAPRSRVGARAAPAQRSLPARTPRLPKVSGLASFGPDTRPKRPRLRPQRSATPACAASLQRLRQPEPGVRTVGERGSPLLLFSSGD